MRRPNWHAVGYALVVLLSIVFLWAGSRLATGGYGGLEIQEKIEVIPARVDRILSRDERLLEIEGLGRGPLKSVTLYFEATVTGGPRKGASLTVEQAGDPFSPVSLREAEIGDRVMLISYDKNGDGSNRIWLMQEFDRTPALFSLIGVFLLFLILFGRGKGVSTVLTLIFTCGAIFAVFIPALLSGYNIYIITLITCTYIVLMTLALVNGFNTKSLSAAVGCLGGVLVTGALVKLMEVLLALTGYISEESAYLFYLRTENPIDLKAIVFSGILIGAVGAILDVAVSMASSISEIKENAPFMGFGALVRSGLNIGRDILGTMSNTLILAYIGGSLSLSLLLIVYSNSLLELLNREMIVVEILQAVVGSIGLLAAIPLTAVFASYVYTRKRT